MKFRLKVMSGQILGRDYALSIRYNKLEAWQV
jgi:hypothetical protein